MSEDVSPGRPFTVVTDGEPGALFGAVVAIGNFDGVHRGHRKVIDAALQRAAELGRKAAAVTFSPHPRRFLQPDVPLFSLSSDRNKLRLLAATGLDGAIVFPFDADFAATTAEDFVQRILVENFGLGGVAIGYDFHFGKGRAGSPNFLAFEGTRLGFPVDVVPPLEDEGRPVSSGAIREALSQGKVIHGEKRGRDLGFPTANIRLDPSCQLKHGIYAVRADIDGTRVDGVASFGTRPTFDDGAPLLEIFLLDFAGDLYGKTLDVAFIGWVRHEQKFPSIEALKRNMIADVAQARDSLKRSGKAFPALGAV
jgi:riboflavin kinase/FMN adenylyltransferase